jgi:hypothetical protein
MAFAPRHDEFRLARGFDNTVALTFGLLARGPSGYALFQTVRLAVRNSPDILKPLRDVMRRESLGHSGGSFGRRLRSLFFALERRRGRGADSISARLSDRVAADRP